MDDRQPGYQTTATQNPASVSAAPGNGAAQWPPSAVRPLSDIREITEPSLIDIVKRQSGRQQLQHRRDGSRAASLRRGQSIKRIASVRNAQVPAKGNDQKSKSTENASSSYSSTPEQSSLYSIPHSSVPKRCSSQNQPQRSAKGHARQQSVRNAKDNPFAHPCNDVETAPLRPIYTIPNRGQSRSPVKDAALRLDLITSDVAKPVPSRTFIRSPHPSDILEHHTYRHPRIRLELQVSAPLFVGGGSIEGFVKVTVDENERLKHRRTLGVGSISVDLLGVEELSGHRKDIFLALGTDLIDADQSPPSNMIEPANPLITLERFWTLKSSISALPFMISLPLEPGPPPFQSKQANIRFLLCATVQIRDAGKHYRVRTSQDVHVLPTYDPEKALTSLPSPLTASDELPLHRGGSHESLKLTAGLHRQVWVSGGSVFVDIHIANKTRRLVKRLDLTLERDVLSYRHAPAATREKSASQARIFESNDQTVVARVSHRQAGNGWGGIDPHTSETRTCDLEVPRGHATVKCGKYFEVRFFLNVIASLSNSKLVSVQLPVILIHINSLDVLPNSVAQVAAAIEEKRAGQHHTRSHSRNLGRLPSRQLSVSSPARSKDIRRQPSYTQGRAFSAPRQQSLDRQRAERADLDELQQIIDTSPRKNKPQGLIKGAFIKKKGSNVSFGDISLGGKSVGGSSVLEGIAYRTPPSNRKARHFDGAREEVEILRDRLQRMRSFDSMHSKKTIARIKPRKAHDQNENPVVTHAFE